VTLTNASNDFGGTATVTGANVSLVDANALTAALTASGTGALQSAGNLAASGSAAGLTTTTTAGGTTSFGATTVTGNLGVTSAGVVTQTGALNVTGTSTVTATGQDVTLTNASNDFGGTATVTGANVSLVDANALTAALTASGTGALQSAGNLAASGSAAGLTTTTTAGGTTSFGATTVTGNLGVTSAGVVTQTGALNVTGTSTVTATGQDVTLTNASNDFGGTATVTGANVSLVDANALTAALTASGTGALQSAGNLAASGSAAGLTTTTTAGGTTSFGATTVTGNLGVTSAGAATQTGALNVTGTSTVTATGQDVTLTNAGNDFGGTATVTGANVSLADANAIDLGATTASGNLAVTSVGAVTDSGTLTVTGTTTVTAGAANVTLDQAANTYTGNLAITTTGNVELAGDAQATTTVSPTANNITLRNFNSSTAGLSLTAVNDVIIGTNNQVAGDLALTGKQILGDSTMGVSSMTVEGSTIALTATTGDIGSIGGNVDGSTIPDINPNVLGLAALSGKTLNLSVPAGKVTYLLVDSASDFLGASFVGSNGATTANTWGCFTASECVNLDSTPSQLGQSVGTALVSSLLADAALQAFGTDNLTVAIQEGILTKIGVTPPGIDDIQGDLGSIDCESALEAGEIKSSESCGQ